MPADEPRDLDAQLRSYAAWLRDRADEAPVPDRSPVPDRHAVRRRNATLLVAASLVVGTVVGVAALALRDDTDGQLAVTPTAPGSADPGPTRPASSVPSASSTTPTTPTTSTTDSTTPTTSTTTSTTTPTTAPKTTAPTTTAPPPADAAAIAALAERLGLATVVAERPGAVTTWVDGVVTEIAVDPGAWVYEVDGYVVVHRVETGADGVPVPRTRVLDLDGSTVCETVGEVHRVRRRDDGSHVVSVNRTDGVVVTGDETAVPNDAVDCATGERQPIDPVLWFREGGSRSILRAGDRTFTSIGDAEGNAVVTNEAGIPIAGEDEAGWHTFSPDGSRVVYGDLGGSPSPHATGRVRSRDTTTGELLWTFEQDRPFGRLHHLGDVVVVEWPPGDLAASPWEATEYVTVLDATSGALLDTVPTALRIVAIAR